jgi:hypothetical protein
VGTRGARAQRRGRRAAQNPSGERAQRGLINGAQGNNN